MSNLIYSELVLEPRNNADFIEFINNYVPITNPDFINVIEKEFLKRNIDFENINYNGIKLQTTLKLINETLFETDIPKPTMVGSFYNKVMKLSNFLNSHAKRLNYKLITFEFIFDQLFLITYIKTVSDAENITLNSNQIFIILKQRNKLFPSLEAVKENNNVVNYYFIVDKGESYRGLKSVALYFNDKEIDYLDLAE